LTHKMTARFPELKLPIGGLGELANGLTEWRVDVLTGRDPWPARERSQTSRCSRSARESTVGWPAFPLELSRNLGDDGVR
jgi:hypothetical protein